MYLNTLMNEIASKSSLFPLDIKSSEKSNKVMYKKMRRCSLSMKCKTRNNMLK